MTYFLYNKKSKIVKMMNNKSFKHFDTTKLKMITHTLTKIEKVKLDKGYIMKYNRSLKFIKPDKITKKEIIDDLKEELRKELDDDKNIKDLKETLNKIINLI